ncbi:MAG: trigger factor [Patescibacteria group bacterium]
MQTPTIENMKGSSVKLSFTVSPEEAQPYIDEAVIALSEAKPIAGFRPGKAPYAEVAKAYSEMQIWQHALERIVRAWYMRTILDEDIDTVGSPEIAVEQLVPHQEIRFSCIAPIAPKVEKLADYKKLRVDFTPREVKDEDVDKALNELRMMQRKEVVSTEPAGASDLVVIDLDIEKDHVALEDGAAKGYRVYLGEPHYIPGFTEKLIGMKKGEERTFTLPFPVDHYQKHLAGKDVDFKAKATEVYTVGLPEIDDDFARSLGQKDVNALKEIIKKNMGLEEEEKARDKAEIELLEKLTDESTFSEIPDLLVSEEVRKMLGELEASIDERGMKMEDYLASIKKTKDQLRLEFVPQALRRIHVATLIKNVAKLENIRVSEQELDTEIDRILNTLRKEDTETRERVSSPEYREYVGIVLRNRKALDVLRKNGIKGYPEHIDNWEDEEHECHDENCGHEHEERS